MATKVASGRVKLTNQFLNSIKPTGKREKYRDATVPGLLLRVGPDALSQVWYFDYRNREGNRKLYKIGSILQYNLTSAKAAARKVAAQVADGRDPAAEKSAARLDRAKAKTRTLRAYLYGDYWTRHLQHNRSGKATQERIASAWKPFLDADLEMLKHQKLMDHRSMRLRSGIQASTLNRDRTALMALLNHAVEDGLIPENPVANFKRLKLDQDERVRYLSPNERARFMAALEHAEEYFQVMVKLALLSGMRRGELLRLTWPNVDLRREEIVIRAQTAKSAKKRVIPLPSSAVKLMREWKGKQAITDMEQHVFLNPSTRRPYTGVKRQWQKLVDYSEIENFRFHDCRHDYASRLVEAGIDLYRVKELLGHSSIEQTQRYAHLSDEAKRAAVEVLA